MSRSFKHSPFCGNACAYSEKQDKRFANRCYRRLVRMLLRKGDDELPMLRETSDVWVWAKDGRQHLDAETIEKYPKLVRK